jgi:reactive intermediate/imine deaminase
MAKKVLQPTLRQRPRGPFSLGTQVRNLVFVAGQVSQDAEGNVLHRGDVRAQTREVIGRIREVLAEAGMTLADVVSTTVYLPNLADYPGMNEVYRELFQSDFPARASVRADLVAEGLLVEIAAIAAR